MLASVNRLTSQDFDKVKNEGRLFQSRNFGAIVLKKEKKEVSRFGFVVSTKISKQAYHRNRIKRALRETVRHHLNLIGKGYDVIILTKKSIVKKSTDEMMLEVRAFIMKHLVK